MCRSSSTKFSFACASDMSILNLIGNAKKNDATMVDLTSDGAVISLNVATPVPDLDCYLKSIMRLIDAGGIKMEGQPVIKAISGKLHEIGNGVGSVLLEHLQLDIAGVRGHENGRQDVNPKTPC